MIPYGRQSISEEDIEEVVKVLRSDYLTQGERCPGFEQAVATYCGADFTVAVNSGTSALHLACLALGLAEGDILWTSPITFVASANCALYCGASVDFVDVDPASANISVEALQAKFEQAQAKGKLPKVLIAVHFAGLSCEMVAIKALCDRYGVRIIEDACHALGGRYRGEPVGNCHYSDITVFSFHPVKLVTTGEGGLAVTNDKGLANKMALLRSHGITRDACEMGAKDEGSWYYEQVSLGYNYRMTDMQAALGVSQLKKLDDFIERRNWLAQRYDSLLQSLPLDCPVRLPENYSAYHLYPIQLQLEWLDKTRRDIFEALRAKDIGVNVHYIPVYRQPYYQRYDYDPTAFPGAEYYAERAITLPLYPELKEESQDYVVSVLTSLLS